MNNENNGKKQNKVVTALVVLALLIGLFAAVYSVVQKQKKEIDPNQKTFEVMIAPEDKTKDKTFTIETINDTLGDALVDSGLIEYEKMAVGRFITGVKDFDSADGKYWLIYVNGKSAEVGMDEIILEDGDRFLLALE